MACRSIMAIHPAGRLFVFDICAGGNLAAPVVLRACDARLPAPAALFLGTPLFDITRAGDSLGTNRDIAVLLKALEAMPHTGFGSVIEDAGAGPA